MINEKGANLLKKVIIKKYRNVSLDNIYAQTKMNFIMNLK